MACKKCGDTGRFRFGKVQIFCSCPKGEAELKGDIDTKDAKRVDSVIAKGFDTVDTFLDGLGNMFGTKFDDGDD